MAEGVAFALNLITLLLIFSKGVSGRFLIWEKLLGSKQGRSADKFPCSLNLVFKDEITVSKTTLWTFTSQRFSWSETVPSLSICLLVRGNGNSFSTTSLSGASFLSNSSFAQAAKDTALSFTSVKQWFSWPSSDFSIPPYPWFVGIWKAELLIRKFRRKIWAERTLLEFSNRCFNTNTLRLASPYGLV